METAGLRLPQTASSLRFDLENPDGTQNVGLYPKTVNGLCTI